jgi:hypothetical protein
MLKHGPQRRDIDKDRYVGAMVRRSHGVTAAMLRISIRVQRLIPTGDGDTSSHQNLQFQASLGHC